MRKRIPTTKATVPGIAALVLLTTVGADADLAVSGRPVPALARLDTIMTDFMTDSSRAIPAGVLGISRGGRVVFLRAYGELRPGVPLPETALFRQASIVKPITAAAIHAFAASGGLGPSQLQRPAFNLAGNGGVLSVAPPASPDPRCQNVTVGHLLNHAGGWDRNQPWPGDIPIWRVRDAGIAMNEPDALPTRRQLLDWALQYPLDFAPGAATYTPATPPGSPSVVPGAQTTYSNFGYLILGEILEALAPGGYLGYVRNNIMSARNWVPGNDWGPAHTLQAELDTREPGYVSDEAWEDSVFDYSPHPVKLPRQYGGWHLETMLAHGGLIASSQAMLRFGSLYRVAYITKGAGATQSNDIGLPVTSVGLLPGSDFFHTGGLPGTSTILRQITGGAGGAEDVVIHIAFNKRSSASADWAQDASDQVVNFLNTLGIWPTATCDGFWVALGAENPGAGFGGFDTNYQGFQSALDRVSDGSYLRLRPGAQGWRGTIRKRVRLDAPEGAVTLGR
jgi:CubicO group peptidase (beta-lactamase class C family)